MKNLKKSIKTIKKPNQKLVEIQQKIKDKEAFLTKKTTQFEESLKPLKNEIELLKLKQEKYRTKINKRAVFPDTSIVVPLFEESIPPFEEIIDDLKLIEGIYIKIESILNKNGILTYNQLLKKDLKEIETIIEEAGLNINFYKPNYWVNQASFILNKNWTELKVYQEAIRSKAHH